MNTTLHLDTTDGRITAFGIVVDPDLRADSLPACFVKTSQAVHIEGRLVDCVFARATGVTGDMTVQLELRFEEAVLVSGFITLDTPRLRKRSADDFYGSIDEHYRFHQRWLASMGVVGGSAAFAWGRAGVARDRSENVHIYVHNRNNRWAGR